MTEKLFFVISEITWIFVTFIQNHFRNTCYLWYTTVTRTLRLFADVLNFLKCKYCTLSLIPNLMKTWYIHIFFCQFRSVISRSPCALWHDCVYYIRVFEFHTLFINQRSLTNKHIHTLPYIDIPHTDIHTHEHIHILTCLRI